MKRFSKKLISILMAVILVALTAVPAFAAVDENGEALPIVYVIGKVDNIYQDKDDPNSKVLYPISLDIKEKYKKKLLKSVTNIFSNSDDDAAWDELCDAIYNVIAEACKDIALNENGEPKDNSGIIWDWKSDLKDTKENGLYGLEDYVFHYDWRLDMFHNAELLDEYINAVLDVTGAKKCVLVSRCYGCNVATTYLSKYGNDKIDTNVLYCSVAAGSVVCGEMFSGQIEINPEGLDRYVDELLGVNPITAILGQLVGSVPGLSTITSSLINLVYEKISDRLMPKSLVSSFASMPGYWSMVNTDYFADAKNYVFGSEGSEDRQKYAGLIEKIDYYYDNILVNVKDIVTDAYNTGTKYANITKYGNQIVPAIKSCDYIGDGIVEVPSASFGATSVLRNQTFSAEYINDAISYGKFNYISPDYTIDASTALFPDYTWFAEGVEHFDFPKSVDKLILAIARYDGQMDVYSNPDFPQYAKYEGEGNMLTWALGGYIGSSDSSIFKTIRSILETLKKILSILNSVLGGLN